MITKKSTVELHSQVTNMYCNIRVKTVKQLITAITSLQFAVLLAKQSKKLKLLRSHLMLQIFQLREKKNSVNMKPGII